MERAERKPGISKYLAAIIINVILIYVFNNLLNWNVTVLTDDFKGVLWALDISLGATILINILFLMYDAGWFRHLMQLILNVIAILVTFLILVIFPFTFASESWAVWVRVGLIIIMAGIGIGTIVEFFRLILGRE